MGIREKDIITCADCGRTTLRRGPSQRYCVPCSTDRDRVRKAAWAREHPIEHTSERRAQTRDRSERRRRLGAEASIHNRNAEQWAPLEGERGIRVVVPYNRRFSKNALWSMNSPGHVYMREEIKEVRDELIFQLRAAGGEWFDGKVWIDLFVEKPDARSDAINVLDLICDAVKVAIEVDDRWFSIRRVDWSVVKFEPRIYVAVTQAVSEHHRVCSYCGVIKPLGDFAKNRSGPHGHGRECSRCRNALRSFRPAE